MQCFDDDRLDYNPETGKFIWLVSSAICVKPGDLAGSQHSKGYWHIRVRGRLTYAHHLAWNTLYPNDLVMPGEEIDHINHVRDDNRAVNLVKKKHLANGRNKSRAVNNTSGATGVYWIKKNQKWRAAIRVDDILIHLGTFDSFEAALLSRKEAELKHGFHENHGKESPYDIRP